MLRGIMFAVNTSDSLTKRFRGGNGAEMKSVWTETAHRPAFPQLDGDIRTDVLIIGGGIAGILCAYMLQRDGVDYALAEAGNICSGVTENTTAKITLQHGLIYDKLMRRFGTEKAKMYYEANRGALERYRELCREIDCDFEEVPSFVYSLGDRRKIENELAALNSLGCRAELAEELELPFGIAGAVRISGQAQFNPLKFLYHISKNLQIYENTRVTELRPGCAVTERGKIFAKKIIVATHFPFLNKHGSYFLKMYQHRSYVLALKGAPDVNGIYVDEADKGMSFRNYAGLLFVGGGDHRTGKKGGAWGELESFAKRNYPSASVKYRWSTQDCMTLDGVPYIGQYSANTPELYVSSGFNKWGMTSAMAAAEILADMVCGRGNPYAAVFSPSRTILRPRLAVNAAEAVINLLTPTSPRCPHLGCALKYNKAEHSWDCPCHGSRFSDDGELLDNPATGDMKNPRKS